jgi:hypothetical protein
MFKSPSQKSTPVVGYDRVAKYAEERALLLAGAEVLEDLGERAHAMDRDRWRRRVGLTDASSRSFIMTGSYPDARAALLSRGWKQIPDPSCPHFDLQWALQAKEVNYSTIGAHQMANHFPRAGAITTKAGLIHVLESAHQYTPADRMEWYPRAYDLGDAEGYADFADEFRGVAAEGVLRDIASRVWKAAGAAAAGTSISVGSCTSEIMTVPTSSGSKFFEKLITGPPEALKLALLSSAVVDYIKQHSAATTSLPPTTAALSPILVNQGVLRVALAVTRKRTREWNDADLDGEAEEGEEGEGGGEGGGGFIFLHLPFSPTKDTSD